MAKSNKITGERDAIFAVAVGTNGTGKTTYWKQFLGFNKRNLIIPANRSDSTKAWGHVKEIPVDAILKKVTGLGPLDWELLDDKKHRELRQQLLMFMGKVFRAIDGNAKIVLNQRNKVLFDCIIHDELGFTNGGLFFDDFKNYIPAYNPPGNVIQMLSDRRHKGVDMFLATHSPNKIPAPFFDYGPQLVVFKTTRSFETAKEKIELSLYNELVAAQARINRQGLPPKGNGPRIGPYEVITIPEQ